MRSISLLFSLLLFGFIGPVSSFPASAAIGDTTVTRQGGQLVLNWKSEGPVDVFLLEAPGARGRLVATQVTAAGLLVDGNLPFRPYFRLEAKGQASVTTAERLLPLEGGRNFRDLGGYTTPEGRSVKWGRLYRSGVMSELTDADYEYLSGLGIKIVCDLRATDERSSEPTRWRTTPAANYVSWDYEMPASALGDLFQDGLPTAAKTRNTMMTMYHEIAYEHAPRYRVMFDELAKGNLPMAFNCSAGKDRAGTAAALILSALGVEREQIVHDYALSETYVDYMQAFASPEVAESDSPYAYLARLPPETIMPLMRSDPAYIEATFAELEKNHGSVLAFIQAELDVSDAELAQIRALLLE